MAETPAHFWPNQTKAAAELGVGFKVITAAKVAGCRAFRGGRIYKDDLAKWLLAHPHGTPQPNGRPYADSTDSDLRLKAAKASREELRLSRERGELLDRPAVQEAIRVCTARLIALLERELTNELPPVLKGLDEVGIRLAMSQRLERIAGQFRDEIGLIK